MTLEGFKTAELRSEGGAKTQDSVEVHASFTELVVKSVNVIIIPYVYDALIKLEQSLECSSSKKSYRLPEDGKETSDNGGCRRR